MNYSTQVQNALNSIATEPAKSKETLTLVHTVMTEHIAALQSANMLVKQVLDAGASSSVLVVPIDVRNERLSHALMSITQKLSEAIKILNNVEN